MLEKFRHYRERIKEGMLRDMWRQTLWIYEYARLYWKQMIFYTLLGLAGTLVSLISSLISRDMVDIITGQQAGLLARTFCLYIGFSVGNVLISQISNYFANKISISVDNAEAMDQAVRYLKSLGHKKIGYLSHALGSYVYQQRYQAFFRAVQANGLPCSESLGKCDFFTSGCLSEHLPALLEQGCTAIVCSHDRLANSVLIDCQERGIRVPEDLSVLGFDDLPLCRFTPPPLTTIRQNRAELGKSAYFALSSQLHDVSISLIQLHTELIVRSSCGKAPRRPQAKKRIPRAEPVTKKERNDEA